MFRKLRIKLGRKFRLSIIDHESLKQTRVFIVSRLGMLIILGFSTSVLVGGTIAVFMYTPVRQIIPGYTNPALVQEVDTLRSRVATLQKMVGDYESYLNSISAIAGGGPNFPGRRQQSSVQPQDSPHPSGQTEGAAPTRSSSIDEVTAHQNIEKQEGKSLSSITFFRPARGVLKNKFDLSTNHTGIDILTPADEIIKSMADGYVVFVGYSAENGNSVAVDNGGGIITIFKNLAHTYKVPGQFVNGGDPLGVAGTRGEKLAGHSLHLELWSNGSAVNPEKFIQLN